MRDRLAAVGPYRGIGCTCAGARDGAYAAVWTQSPGDRVVFRDQPDVRQARDRPDPGLGGQWALSAGATTCRRIHVSTWSRCTDPRRSRPERDVATCIAVRSAAARRFIARSAAPTGAMDSRACINIRCLIYRALRRLSRGPARRRLCRGGLDGGNDAARDRFDRLARDRGLRCGRVLAGASYS